MTKVQDQELLSDPSFEVVLIIFSRIELRFALNFLSLNRFCAQTGLTEPKRPPEVYGKLTEWKKETQQLN